MSRFEAIGYLQHLVACAKDDLVIAKHRQNATAINMLEAQIRALLVAIIDVRRALGEQCERAGIDAATMRVKAA